jgi:endonuclease YncB( thermonuclease family)
VGKVVAFEAASVADLVWLRIELWPYFKLFEIVMRICFLAALLFSAPAFASSVQVVDGDTLKIDNVAHRLHGIDAPEEGQKCKGGGKRGWPCGKVATDEMARIASLGPIKCKSQGNDGYGREISVCWQGDLEINRHMVRQGFAWAFRKYSQDYAADEGKAKSEGLGIWREESQTAWEFREARWNVAAQEAPEGCPIKGNISRNGRIYHAPWSPWYKRTKINLKKGERWFCSEAEAVQAGWRAPHWR